MEKKDLIEAITKALQSDEAKHLPKYSPIETCESSKRKIFVDNTLDEIDNLKK